MSARTDVTTLAAIRAYYDAQTGHYLYPGRRRKLDRLKITKSYREARANLSEEALAEDRLEARAAHGPGVQIYDIITKEFFTT